MPCTLQGPVRFGVLNPSNAPQIKHRRTVAPVMPMARHRKVEGRDLWKPETQRGDSSLVCEDSLNSSGCKLPSQEQESRVTPSSPDTTEQPGLSEQHSTFS